VHHIREQDLSSISEAFRRLVENDLPLKRLEFDSDIARNWLSQQPLVAYRLAQQATPSTRLSLYQSDNYIGLTSIPLLPRTGLLHHHELVTTAASHWWALPEKTNAAQHITRVSGVVFSSAEQRRQWHQRLTEAQHRDHRVIGTNQQLFTFHPVSPGGVFFLPHGTRIVHRLLDFVRSEYRRFNYHEVMTPMIFKQALWEQSGHWQNYARDMFSVRGGLPVTNATPDTTPTDWYGLKPMNCPAHCLLYASQPRTHQDLPIRFADFGSLHRWEAAGSLSGLTRVRNFHQDDAHIFCRPDQVGDEIRATLSMIDRIYRALDFSSYELSLATRPETDYIGTLSDWDHAEQALKEALDSTGLAWQVKEGDGAFYGPKIDIMVRDALGRRHQTATIQLDFQLPQRFDLIYHDANAVAQRPVIVHRAVLGSVERMLAILTEHYGGHWPLWLSPRQVMICPVAEKFYPYAEQVRQRLVQHHEDYGRPLYIDVDTSNNTLGKKIRQAQALRYNYILVVGEQEATEQTVHVRRRSTNTSQAMSLDALAQQLLQEVRIMRE
jgi:threonyl-tRNA synthetase